MQAETGQLHDALPLYARVRRLDPHLLDGMDEYARALMRAKCDPARAASPLRS